MFEKLLAWLQERIELTDEEIRLMQSLHIPKKLKKGEYIQREGEVAKYGAFVATGCLRSYIIDSKGKEHIVQFAPENWWISDINSMKTGLPSNFFIDAIEDTETLLCDRPSMEKMLEEIPSFGSLYRSGLQTHTSAKDKRIVSSLSASAEERYHDFLRTYASIAQRVPQHMLASYLGISPETLSRIRKQMATKK